MNEIELAKYIYDSAPLNRHKNLNDIKRKIEKLSINERLNLLVFSFQNYDKNYNKELCLSYTLLWNDFNEVFWKKLILEMFPRKVKFEEGEFKHINTGCYFDIFLLNGIIGVSPFDYILNEPQIDEIEKKSFFSYLKSYGEVFFYFNERELIEDIVNFYELDAFTDIVKMKDYILANSIFKPSKSYSELLTDYINE